MEFRVSQVIPFPTATVFSLIRDHLDELIPHLPNVDKLEAIDCESTGKNKVQIVNRWYAKAQIPVSVYPGAANDADVDTFGVKATFVTSIKVPDNVVYAVTKEVFDNFDKFKGLHPAYQVLTKKGMMEGLSAPLHPGAEKYFKEAGLL